MRMKPVVGALIVGGIVAGSVGAAFANRTAPVPVNPDKQVSLSADEVTAMAVLSQEAGTIVEVAAQNGSFDTLVKAVRAAGLVETLNGKGPYTVFAPTDEAFSKLPEGQLNELLNNRERLAQVLSYHVVAGQVMGSDVKNMSSAETLAGPSLSISTDYGSVRVNDAKVVQTDVMASNGVIHVIDSVLLPKNASM